MATFRIIINDSVTASTWLTNGAGTYGEMQTFKNNDGSISCNTTYWASLDAKNQGAQAFNLKDVLTSWTIQSETILIICPETDGMSVSQLEDVYSKLQWQTELETVGVTDFNYVDVDGNIIEGPIIVSGISVNVISGTNNNSNNQPV